jgi:hypothetical protein
MRWPAVPSALLLIKSIYYRTLLENTSIFLDKTFFASLRGDSMIMHMAVQPHVVSVGAASWCGAGSAKGRLGVSSSTRLRFFQGQRRSPQIFSISSRCEETGHAAQRITEPQQRMHGLKTQHRNQQHHSPLKWTGPNVNPRSVRHHHKNARCAVICASIAARHGGRLVNRGLGGPYSVHAPG